MSSRGYRPISDGKWAGAAFATYFALTGLVKKSNFLLQVRISLRDLIEPKQIIFWRSYNVQNHILRFPYWMWHLDWAELELVPEYPRYGMPLSIDRLMRPICEAYNREQILSRLNCAVLFSSHLRSPRRQLFEILHSTLGLDGWRKRCKHEWCSKITNWYCTYDI